MVVKLAACQADSCVPVSCLCCILQLTRVGAKRKAQVEEEHKEGGRRNAVQVLANSLAACVFAELLYVLSSAETAAADGTHTGGWLAQLLLRGGVDVQRARVLLAGGFLVGVRRGCMPRAAGACRGPQRVAAPSVMTPMSLLSPRPLCTT